ncbi:universal stress protein [Actinoplanes sp. NPDC049599]|uniref:universal stress protein n=1 Tax=Actinoplanes sp. NPDC049599 TaxID=3363903 RepID=UPI003790BBB5
MGSAWIAPVVVGVDGSASSLSAVRLAARHASSYGCSLHIVHAFNWLPRWPEATGADPAGGAAAHEVVRRAASAAHEAAPGVVTVTRLLEGAATSTLLRLARTAVLLAVGDGGLSGQVCLPTRTSAVHIAARAACSVLVARRTAAHGGPIVVGVNGSSASEHALDFAFDTAVRQRAELVVVRATAADPPTGDEWREVNDLVAPRQHKYHLTARIRVLPGEPQAVLVAASMRAGLVVIGARGNQPYRGLLGSAAQTLLHHSPAPVILVRGMMPPPLEASDPHTAARSRAVPR